MIGSAIYHAYHQGHREGYVIHKPAYRSGRSRPAHRRQHPRQGHWELKKEWVPAVYKRVWNPGHYNRHGRWVRGRWVEIIDEPGYWVEKKVWVSNRKCR
jgi:hypothetical protein